MVGVAVLGVVVVGGVVGAVAGAGMLMSVKTFPSRPVVRGMAWCCGALVPLNACGVCSPFPMSGSVPGAPANPIARTPGLGPRTRVGLVVNA